MATFRADAPPANSESNHARTMTSYRGRSAQDLTARPGVDGLDLLAYRHAGDVADLIEQVVAAATGPVVVAGSIDTAERIQAVSSAGAWGFTVGGAVFDRAFVRGGSMRTQIDEILRQADPDYSR